MGLLLAAEAALALWMTGFVWVASRDPELFPTITRYPVSIVGAAAGTGLAVYCAVLALLVVGSLGKVTPLQQRLGRNTRRVHVGIGAVASVVWLWTGWPTALGPEDVLGPAALMVASLAWSKLVMWTLAWRESDP
jgi:hypothetical protein